MQETVSSSRALAKQLDYYRARAAEYDQWWLRQGRFDRGPAANAGWFADVEAAEAALRDFAPGGHILELAGGTGIWTQVLLPHATSLTVVDAAPEMIALNEARLGAGHAKYIEADIFEWQPPRQYDTIFFGFWLSHVPEALFDDFWRMLRAASAPGGRVFFIDSLPDSNVTPSPQEVQAGSSIIRRRLNDGSEHHIYKIYYAPENLSARLAKLGWRVRVLTTPRYFIYGYGSAAPVAESGSAG